MTGTALAPPAEEQTIKAGDIYVQLPLPLHHIDMTITATAPAVTPAPEFVVHAVTMGGEGGSGPNRNGDQWAPVSPEMAEAWQAGAPVEEKIGVSVANLNGVVRAAFVTDAPTLADGRRAAWLEDLGLAQANAWLLEPNIRLRHDAMDALEHVNPALFAVAHALWIELTDQRAEARRVALEAAANKGSTGIPADQQAEQQPNQQTDQMAKNDTCDAIAGSPEELNFELLLPVSRDLEDRFPIRARTLHQVLGVGKFFANWIKDRIEQFELIDGKDYSVRFPKTGSKECGVESSGRGGQNATEYWLTLKIAKELAMLQNNQRGKAVRRYFIRCEEELLRIAEARSLTQPPDMSDPLVLALKFVEAEQGRRLALAGKDQAERGQARMAVETSKALLAIEDVRQDLDVVKQDLQQVKQAEQEVRQQRNEYQPKASVYDEQNRRYHGEYGISKVAANLTSWYGVKLNRDDLFDLLRYDFNAIYLDGTRPIEAMLVALDCGRRVMQGGDHLCRVIGMRGVHFEWLAAS